MSEARHTREIITLTVSVRPSGGHGRRSLQGNVRFGKTVSIAVDLSGPATLM
jgi:hypothetical protein